MKENDITGEIINCCLMIHKKCGPGMLESIYEDLLAYEMSKIHIKYERQKVIPLSYDGIKFDIGFRLDFLVESKVIIELKSVEYIMPVYKKQLLTYLKITELKVGLLINFNSVLLKEGIIRIVNNF